MPTLITPRTRFLHIPKTGGIWVTEALTRAGVSWRPLVTRTGPGARGHADLSQTRRYDDRFSFAFVRHPLALYRSRWAAGMAAGWPSNRRQYQFRSDSFAGFVEIAVAQRPGFLSSEIESYVGPVDSPISFIGRYERLADDLVRALSLAGETFDERALRETAPTNINDYSRWNAHYDDRLRELVLAAEAPMVHRWYSAEQPG